MSLRGVHFHSDPGKQWRWISWRTNGKLWVMQLAPGVTEDDVSGALRGLPMGDRCGNVSRVRAIRAFQRLVERGCLAVGSEKNRQCCLLQGE
jgi:hypothetical protein